MYHNIPAGFGRADPARLRLAQEQSDWNFLWEQAIPLVKFAASIMVKGGMDRENLTDDLFADANLAAGAATRKWDPNLGAFSNFIIRRATGAMHDHLRRLNSIVGGRDVRTSSSEYQDITPDDSATAEEAMVSASDVAEARALIASIPDPRARRIVCLRFGIDTTTGHVYSLTEIGKELKLSRAYVHRVLSNTLKNLQIRVDELHTARDY
jgi:RNA polymerase sigma factor (sigma-70 family)